MKKLFAIIIALHASLFAFHLSAQVVNGVIVSDSNNVTVVKLWGTSQERGFAYGYLMGDEIAIGAEQWIIPWYGNDYELARALIEEGTKIKIDSVYREEAKAVIEGMDAAGFNSAGYDYLDILAGTIWQDVGSNWPFSKKKDRMNCSAFMNWNDATAGTDLNGCSVISHHLDWWFIPESCFNRGSIIVHIPSEEGQQPWLMVDFAGYIAPGSCCNASGYCIATDGLNVTGGPDTSLSYTPYRFMIRKVLETSDYNQDGEYNMLDIREAISDQENGYISGSIFSILGPSTAIHDSLIALIAEVAPEEPFITFRTNSYEDMMPGDNLYAANNPIARNNLHYYCPHYLAMVDTIGDGTNISSEANWEMMRVHSNGGNGNLVFMQFIPEWNQLKLSFCQKINDTIYPAYLGEPSVFDLEELFTIPVSIKEEMNYDYQLILSPNPAAEEVVVAISGQQSAACPEGEARRISSRQHVLRAKPEGSPVGSWQLAVGQNVELTIYDLFGREVRMLMDEVKSPGEYNARMDVSDLPAGVYLVRLKAGGESIVRKLIVK